MLVCSKAEPYRCELLFLTFRTFEILLSNFAMLRKFNIYLLLFIILEFMTPHLSSNNKVHPELS